MILFAPSHDPATAANLGVAEQLATAASTVLLGKRATRKELLIALEHDEGPLFVMSHGKPDHFVGHQGQVALSAADVPILGARSVFAFACHTATHLGALAAEQGSVWWGYTGAIQCPDCPDIFRAHFVEIFRFITIAYATAKDEHACKAVVLRIAELCTQAEAEFDGAALNDPELNVASAYLCLLHTWNRLRVWVPGLAAPLQHPRACLPSLFLVER